MKLHDLRPAPGSHRRRTRVGRGIAAGGGKTAGRGTKGQKARAGASIPPWFEGGQTPLHQRIPKLRGFRNPFKTQYEVVNLGRIAALVELGALEPGEMPGGSRKGAATAPITVNQEILRAVGLVRTLDKPLKVLGQGEIDRPLFVVADAFSKSAVAKIEAAGGSVQVLEVPTSPLAALGVEAVAETPSRASTEASPAEPPAPVSPVAVETAAPERTRGRGRAAATGTASTATEATATEAAETASAATATPASETPGAEPATGDDA
jgi:large subunit ribosomal protein L15